MAQLAWHPDGTHLLGVGTAGASRVWVTDPTLAEDFLCRNAGTPMTAAEWTDTVTGVPFQALCPAGH